MPSDHDSGLDQNQFKHFDLDNISYEPLASPIKRSVFAPGDFVTVKTGSFESFQGTIINLNEKNHKATVQLNIFGTYIPVELDYSDIRKK